jgi:hypothetical protein
LRLNLSISWNEILNKEKEKENQLTYGPNFHPRPISLNLAPAQLNPPLTVFSGTMTRGPAGPLLISCARGNSRRSSPTNARVRVVRLIASWPGVCAVASQWDPPVRFIPSRSHASVALSWCGYRHDPSSNSTNVALNRTSAQV